MGFLDNAHVAVFDLAVAALREVEAVADAAEQVELVLQARRRNELEDPAYLCDELEVNFVLVELLLHLEFFFLALECKLLLNSKDLL